MSKLAVDVHYRDDRATVAGVSFRQWSDERAEAEFVSRLEGVSGYVPGAFYRRELPCILALLKEHGLEPDCIVIDGYVYLDGLSRPGLGKHLYDALQGGVGVIGVAKTPYKGISGHCALYRGNSAHPLFVTAAGLDVVHAKDFISTMHGSYRIPTLLKRVDRLSREPG